MLAQRHSFWWTVTPPDFSYQSQLPLYVDAIIIGAGIAGMSMAYWLARFTKKEKKTFRVLVLEEAPYAAFKASGRFGGGIYLGSNKTPATIVKALGVRQATSLYRYSAQNNRMVFNLVPRGLDAALESNGGIRMASTAKEVVDLDDSHEFLQSKLDIVSARFDHNTSQHLAVSPYTLASLFIPGEGMIDPFAYCNNLARLLKSIGGVAVQYGTRIETVDKDHDGSYVVLSNGHKLRAGSIIHTTTKTIPVQKIKDQVVYKREHIVRTQPFGEDLDDMVLPLMPIELGSGDSVRLHNRSLVMTGGKCGMKRDVEEGNQNDTCFNQRIFDQLNTEMLRHFPFTNVVELSHVWTYIETSMQDGLPIMGAIPGYPNQYVNAAHGRNKFGLGFLGAKNIAETILGIKVPNEEFKIFTPSRLVGNTDV
jgi:glycine/D-amino acid oxidase-like deaminating enzyme